ncbi:hypothetical protein FRB90_006136 [Tulasnella sp. 427]|nr:hypothetical protein FRB90_006136 [Tulasnella sp. 427]
MASSESENWTGHTAIAGRADAEQPNGDGERAPVDSMPAAKEEHWTKTEVIAIPEKQV